MSRISIAFLFRSVLFASVAALGIAVPAYARTELRRLPIPLNGAAHAQSGTHRLVPEHHVPHRSAETGLAKNELLARAANLLVLNGFTDIKSVRTEGDDVLAEVGSDEGTRNLIVTSNGAITEAEGMTARTTSNEARIDSEREVPSAQAEDAAGSTSDAASPGPLSASNSAP